MDKEDKLDSVMKSLVAIEAVLLGVNGVGGMVGDVRDLKDTIYGVGRDLNGISGDIKAIDVKIENIDKDTTEHTEKIKTLFKLSNTNNARLASIAVQLKVSAFVGGAVATGIIGVLVTGLMNTA